MKINELFKQEYIGKKVIDNSKKPAKWIICQTTLLKCISAQKNIKDYYNLKQLLELEFEFVEDVEEKTGWRKEPEKGIAYYINSNNEIISFYYIKDASFEKKLFENYNYFSTKEKAKEVADFQLELRKTLKCLDTELSNEVSKTFKKDLLEIIENIRDKDSLLYKSYDFAYLE